MPRPALIHVSRLDQIQWLLLIFALALAGLAFAYVHESETQRIHDAESDRLQALTMVLGNDIALDLGAANRALEGIIAYVDPDASGLPGKPSHRLIALVNVMPGVRTLFVLDAEGVVTASTDGDGTYLNQPGSFFNRHRDSGQVASVLTGIMHVKNERRLAALHTIQPVALAMNKALVLMLNRDLAALNQPLQRQGIAYAVLYGMLVLLSCAGLYWMQVRRAQVVTWIVGRDRRQADERLTLALRGANLGLWNADVGAAALTLDDNSLAIIGLARQDMDADPQFWPGRIHINNFSSNLHV